MPCIRLFEPSRGPYKSATQCRNTLFIVIQSLRYGLRLNNLVANGIANQVHSRVEIRFSHDAIAVSLCCADADSDIGGNFLDP